MTGGRYFTLTEKQYTDLERDSIGLCTGCGAERDSCEPDAREYPCEACGEDAVYGVPELLVMGRIEIVGEGDE